MSDTNAAVLTQPKQVTGTLEVRVKVRGLCLQKFDEDHAVAYVIANIKEAIFTEYKTLANVRDLVQKSKTMSELRDTIADYDHYLEASTPISGFAPKVLCLHPTNGKWVSIHMLDANMREQVKEIMLEFDIFDGQHRAYLFKTLTAEYGDMERETRVAIYLGYHDSDTARRTAIACAHNTNQQVTKSTVDNKNGHYNTMKAALGALAPTVEWVQNSKKNNPGKVLYPPYLILQMIQAIRAEFATENDIYKESNYKENMDEYAPYLSVLPLLYKTFEIIRYESQELFFRQYKTNAKEAVTVMFDGMAEKKEAKESVTGTLGKQVAYPLTKTFSLIVLNSYRSFFGIEGSKHAKLLMESEQEFLDYLRFSLPIILKKISERESKYLQDRNYIRAKRKKNKQKVPGGASRECQLANDRAYQQYRAMKGLSSEEVKDEDVDEETSELSSN